MILIIVVWIFGKKDRGLQENDHLIQPSSLMLVPDTIGGNYIEWISQCWISILSSKHTTQVISFWIFWPHNGGSTCETIKKKKKKYIYIYIYIYLSKKKNLYAKIIYCDHPNKNVEHPNLRITKIWFQQK